MNWPLAYNKIHDVSLYNLPGFFSLQSAIAVMYEQQALPPFFTHSSKGVYNSYNLQNWTLKTIQISDQGGRHQLIIVF